MRSVRQKWYPYGTLIIILFEIIYFLFTGVKTTLIVRQNWTEDMTILFDMQHYITARILW